MAVFGKPFFFQSGADKPRVKRGISTWRKQQIALFFIRALGGRLEAAPRAKAMRWADRLGHFAYQVSKRQRLYADRNLRLTHFPHDHTTQAEREAFVKRVFVHFAKSVVDFLRGPALSPAEFEAIIRADGFEHVEAALQRGKGVILITAHMGNWELLGRYYAARGVPLTVVARAADNPHLENYLRQLRNNAGLSVAPKGGSVRELLTLLKQNKAVGLLPDQNSGDLFAPFFGIPAGTVAGPATLALHTGAALIPSYCVRLPDDTHRLLVLPPIATHSTGDKTADVQRIMGDVNQALEAVIRQYPDQWLWLHNRWKSAFDKKNRDRAWSADDPAAYHDALALWKA